MTPLRKTFFAIGLILVNIAGNEANARELCDPSDDRFEYPFTGTDETAFVNDFRSYVQWEPSCHPADGLSINRFFKRNGNTDGWKGPFIVKYGRVEINGGPGRGFGVDWENKNPEQSGLPTGQYQHYEFDISVVRDYIDSHVQGFGFTTIADLASLPGNNTGTVMTYAVDYGAVPPVGKWHFQSIIWLNKRQGTRAKFVEYQTDAETGEIDLGAPISEDIWNLGSIDVTVAQHYSSERESLRQEAINNDFSNEKYKKFSPYINDEHTYEVYRRLPGDAGERASYLLIRDTNYDPSEGRESVDVRAVLEHLVEVESQEFSRNPDTIEYPDGRQEPVLDSNWTIADLGWEIAGQAKSPWLPNNPYLPTPNDNANSKVNLTFTCYSIPIFTDDLRTNNQPTSGFGLCPDTGNDSPTTPNPSTISLQVDDTGPVVAGQVSGLSEPWTVIFTAETTSGSLTNRAVATDASGMFRFDPVAMNWPEFIDGITVRTYVSYNGNVDNPTFTYQGSDDTSPPTSNEFLPMTGSIVFYENPGDGNRLRFIDNSVSPATWHAVNYTCAIRLMNGGAERRGGTATQAQALSNVQVNSLPSYCNVRNGDSGYLFFQNDIANQYFWMKPNGTGVTGRTWISNNCARTLIDAGINRTNQSQSLVYAGDYNTLIAIAPASEDKTIQYPAYCKQERL